MANQLEAGGSFRRLPVKNAQQLFNDVTQNSTTLSNTMNHSRHRKFFDALLDMFKVQSNFYPPFYILANNPSTLSRMSEAGHVAALYKVTGELPAKHTNESIKNGADFIVDGQVLVPKQKQARLKALSYLQILL